MIPDHVADTLRAKGYKVTRQRQAVLESLAQANGHQTPQELYQRVRQTEPSIGLVTVYRTLEMLKCVGVICELSMPDSGRTYVLGPSDHHHHLVCSGCGTVVNFTTRGLDELEERLRLESGFTITGHVLEFAGVCPNCQKPGP
jgi:Fe2+ or Zn2+ uptake regulation protein